MDMYVVTYVVPLNQPCQIRPVWCGELASSTTPALSWAMGRFSPVLLSTPRRTVVVSALRWYERTKPFDSSEIPPTTTYCFEDGLADESYPALSTRVDTRLKKEVHSP